MEKEEIEELIRKHKKYAEERGIKLNPDKKIVQAIIKGFLLNKKRYGKIYCPCRPVTENKEKDEKIICPCIHHKDEIKRMGHCHCRLFVKMK